MSDGMYELAKYELMFNRSPQLPSTLTTLPYAVMRASYGARGYDYGGAADGWRWRLVRCGPVRLASGYGRRGTGSRGSLDRGSRVH